MPVVRWVSLMLLGLGYCMALSRSELSVAALWACGLLAGAGLSACSHYRIPQILGHGLFMVLAVGLALHGLPGFHNALVIDSVTFSPGATPFSMALNLDKPLIGLWILLVCPWALVPLGARRVSWLAGLIVPATLLGCLGLALQLGVIEWAPKWPPQSWTWVANNLLLVSLTEELLFRGYIQNGLTRLFGGSTLRDGLVMLGVAGLFGLAHLPGGWQWALLAGIAGLGYGLACRYGGLGLAVVAHFSPNLVHFTLFTYPSIAPAS